MDYRSSPLWHLIRKKSIEARMLEVPICAYPDAGACVDLTTAIAAQRAPPAFLICPVTSEHASWLDRWLPADGPEPGDNWYGMDRSQDLKLAGMRFHGQAHSLSDSVIRGFVLGANEGGTPLLCLMNPNSIAKSRASAKTYGHEWEFRELEDGAYALTTDIMGRHPRIHPDPTVPPKTAFMLDLDTWQLVHHGPLDDPKTPWALACHAPRRNVRLSLAC